MNSNNKKETVKKQSDFNSDSPAVQAHLTITQSVIQRMASNSASCKAWCITLVSAILVIVADKKCPNLSLIAFIPVALFFFLDVYYLALERCFRNTYNSFINKLRDGSVSAEDVYAVKPLGFGLQEIIRAVASFSVWPFYSMLAIMIIIARIILIG